MDLLQTVRKEGSRGGVNFSWDDVKASSHRQNYLGHSVMAPTGRWQQGKDLGWYARAEDAELTAEQRQQKEQERKREELRKIKEAEEDAMARAMGLPVPDRSNANMEPLGMSREKQEEVNKALKEALNDEDDQQPKSRDMRTVTGTVGIVREAIATSEGQGDLDHDREIANAERGCTTIEIKAGHDHLRRKWSGEGDLEAGITEIIMITTRGPLMFRGLGAARESRNIVGNAAAPDRPMKTEDESDHPRSHEARLSVVMALLDRKVQSVPCGFLDAAMTLNDNHERVQAPSYMALS